MINNIPQFSSTKLQRNILAATIAAASMAAVQPVVAEQFVLEEIIVTAQKRDQSLQDVPVAISAFSGEALEKASIKNLNQVVAYTPGLAGQNQTGNNLDHLSIRGVTSSDFGVGGDLSVGVYENGVYRPRSGGALGFYDMERVEILKGPQGLLFGRNATSGAVSATTRRASEEVEGDFTFGLSERNGSTFSGVVNTPITDDLFVRVAGEHVEQQGHVENHTTGQKMLGTNNDEMRASFHYAGFEETTIDLILDYSDIERSSGETYSRTTTALSGLPLDLVGLAGSDQPYVSHNDYAGVNESEFYGAALEVVTDLNANLSLTSLTGYRDSITTYGEDFDAVDLVASHFTSDTKSEYFSQEFRLNYAGEKVTWFAGISGYNQSISSDFVVDSDSDALCHWAFGDVCSNLILGGGVGDPDADLILTLIHLTTPSGSDTAFQEISSISGKNKGWAAYGDVTFHLAEEWDLSLGARYTYDKKTYERESLPVSNFGVVLGGLHGGYATDGKLKKSDNWKDFSPRVALSYSPTDELNFYATASKGYKSGGFDSFGFANTELDFTVPLTSNEHLNSYDQEEIMSYEVGIKSQWLGNRLHLNASSYYYSYIDMQLISRQGNAYIVQNVGEATGQGVELEVRYLPAENWNVFFGAAYSDTEAKLTEQENLELCEGVNCDGNRLPYSPRVTTIAAVSYQAPIAIDGYEIFTTLEHSYQASSYAGLESLDAEKNQSIQLINLRAGLLSDQWRLTFFVDNLEDKSYFNQRETGATGDIQTVPSTPRTAGVKLSVEF